MENETWRTFVVVDPGTTTGLAMVDLSDEFAYMGTTRAEEFLSIAMEEGFMTTEEVDTTRWWESVLALRIQALLMDAVGEFWDEVPIVVEDFILRTRDKKKKTLDPIRVTSATVALLWSAGWHGKLVLQQPADAKSVATNDRLREWGLWVVGSEHERDAVRHAVVYLRRQFK